MNNYTKFAEKSNWSNIEITMLKIFNIPNDEWIYLSRELISEWFTNNRNNNQSIKDFYNRKLKKECELNLDYFEIYRDNPLIDEGDKNYHNYKQQNLDEEKKEEFSPKQYGNRAKFYVVTGGCFKMLGMLCNVVVRRCYIKLNSLKINYLEEEKERQKTIAIELRKQFVNELTNVKKYYKHLNVEKNEFIYILHDDNIAHKNLYKVGRTKNLKSRMSTYQTGREPGSLRYACVFPVYNSVEAEFMLKPILMKYRQDPKKEIILLHYDRLVDKVKHTTDFFNSEYEEDIRTNNLLGNI